MSGSNILFILTGSIAAAKACTVISALVQRGHRVRPVITAAGLRFIGPATLEGLTGEAPQTDLFAPGTALEHIELARWADLTVVCPATAHSLNRFAAGLADDLAGALMLARERERPLLIVPAMNPEMWSHPATRAAVARLQEWGARLVSPGQGRTACGEVGEGRMAEPEEILTAVDTALARPAQAKRILVTSGATAELLDGVRVLTNTSTGRTGAELARFFATAGHHVTLLRAAAAPPAGAPVADETFVSFEDLDRALTRLLAGTNFDVVVHAAAVGDFGIGSLWVDGVERPPGGAKLDSGRNVLLELRPQPKLVDTLRERSRNPALTVIAFKLTDGATPAGAQAAIETLFQRARVDLVVHNDNAQRGEAAGQFPATIHRRRDHLAMPCANRAELAKRLTDLIDASDNPSTPSSHAALP
jgi:phosphopantothenoylcysteine decarboxylase/phosphopantothenate--cysteine ligase